MAFATYRENGGNLSSIKHKRIAKIVAEKYPGFQQFHLNIPILQDIMGVTQCGIVRETRFCGYDFRARGRKRRSPHQSGIAGFLFEFHGVAAFVLFFSATAKMKSDNAMAEFNNKRA